MRKRDIRKRRLEHQRQHWRDAWQPIGSERELYEQRSDEAWKDAIAEANSRGDELERLSYDETRKRSAR